MPILDITFRVNIPANFIGHVDYRVGYNNSLPTGKIQVLNAKSLIEINECKIIESKNNNGKENVKLIN